MMRCKLIIDFPYEGEAETLEEIQKEVHQQIIDEELSFADIIAAGGASVEVLANETTDAE